MNRPSLRPFAVLLPAGVAGLVLAGALAIDARESTPNCPGCAPFVIRDACFGHNPAARYEALPEPAPARPAPVVEFTYDEHDNIISIVEKFENK